jgi:hypothetical protein
VSRSLGIDAFESIRRPGDLSMTLVTSARGGRIPVMDPVFRLTFVHNDAPPATRTCPAAASRTRPRPRAGEPRGAERHEPSLAPLPRSRGDGPHERASPAAWLSWTCRLSRGRIGTTFPAAGTSEEARSVSDILGRAPDASASEGA